MSLYYLRLWFSTFAFLTSRQTVVWLSEAEVRCRFVHAVVLSAGMLLLRSGHSISSHSDVCGSVFSRSPEYEHEDEILHNQGDGDDGDDDEEDDALWNSRTRRTKKKKRLVSICAVYVQPLTRSTESSMQRSGKRRPRPTEHSEETKGQRAGVEAVADAHQTGFGENRLRRTVLIAAELDPFEFVRLKGKDGASEELPKDGADLVKKCNPSGYGDLKTQTTKVLRLSRCASLCFCVRLTKTCVMRSKSLLTVSS